MKFYEPGKTRAVITTTVANIAAPTLAEIAAGTELAALIDRGGIEATHDTQTLSRTLWAAQSEVEAPTRFKTTMSIRGYKHVADADDDLWNLLTPFRAVRFMVLRRGLDTATAWAAGQRVETYQFWYGKRGIVTPTGNTASMTVCPLFPKAQDDDATVAA